MNLGGHRLLDGSPSIPWSVKRLMFFQSLHQCTGGVRNGNCGRCIKNIVWKTAGDDSGLPLLTNVAQVGAPMAMPFHDAPRREVPTGSSSGARPICLN